MTVLKVTDYNRRATCGYLDVQNCEGWYDNHFYTSQGVRRQSGYVAYNARFSTWARTKREAVEKFQRAIKTNPMLGIDKTIKVRLAEGN